MLDYLSYAWDTCNEKGSGFTVNPIALEIRDKQWWRCHVILRADEHLGLKRRYMVLAADMSWVWEAVEVDCCRHRHFHIIPPLLHFLSSSPGLTVFQVLFFSHPDQCKRDKNAFCFQTSNLLFYYYLCPHYKQQELDFMTLLVPFQLVICYDSVVLSFMLSFVSWPKASLVYWVVQQTCQSHLMTVFLLTDSWAAFEMLLNFCWICEVKNIIDLNWTWCYKQEGERCFTLSDSDRTKGNGFKLKEGKYRLDVRRKFCTQRAVRPWHFCPESCGCPIPGGAQGHGWGTGQPDLLRGNECMAGVGTGWS